MKKATEMTIQELAAAARNYDNLMNEGGDGYNPFNREMERRAAKSRAKAAAEHAATPQGRIDALHRRIRTECGSVAREWGDTEKIDTLQASLYAEIHKIETEMEANFLATWTLDVTKARRETWNDFIRANFTGRKMTPDDMAKLHARENSQGWTLDDLKKAVKAHNL